jgi:starch-binding outer membrane protein, SusD/RagB family
MKYIIKYLIIFLSVLIVSSCDDTFLDKSHPGTLTYEKFYSTEDDFQASLNACYFSLKPQVQNLLLFTDEMTDNSYLHVYNSTSDYYFFDNCNVPPSSSTIRNFWQACYASINHANMILTRIADSEVPETTQEVFIREAKFIRAYSYFNLVRIYGGVPKYEKETSVSVILETGRSTVDEVYELIISDLKDASDIDSRRSPTQEARAKGKANSNAVKALLGKVYLQIHDFENAKTIFADLVNNSSLELEEDLENLYQPDNLFNKEILFAINYERSAGMNSPFTYWTLPKFSTGILPNVTSQDNGNGNYNIEPYILAKFSSDDKRLALVDSADIIVGSDVIRYYYTKKYLDINTTASGHSGANFIVLRNADVLLMYADALNQSGETNNAYQYINQVRSRAGLNPLPSGYTKAQMNDALADERQKEFIMEGDRWFDLSYRGFEYLKNTLNTFFPNSFSLKEASIEDHEKFFPIPSDEVDLKPDFLQQNLGY